MDTVDRLAAYLAGELDADERTALDGELARDPALRAQLDALRRADAVLAAVRSPEPSAGFDERLRTALDPLLVELVGDTADGSAATAGRGATADPVDELAARRSRRERRNWVPAMVGAAAAAAVLVGGGIVAGGLRGEDDGEASVAMDAMESLDEEAADDAGAADGAMTLEAAPASSDGPTVVVSERELSPDEADALLGSVELGEVAERRLDEAAGAETASRWQAALTGGDAGTADAPVQESDADGDVAADEARDPGTERQVLGAELTGEHEDAIGRCLTGPPVAGPEGAIPVYVEFASFEGEPVLVVGLVTFDPAAGAYTRPQALVLARSDCRVLRSAQG